MKMNLKGKISTALISVSLLMMFSCKKTFDLDPKSEVSFQNNYRNVTDANAAVLGVYGKFLGIAEQYEVLNELRADMMDITPNADKYLREISQHHVTIGNPWADPRPFYSVINECNDVLANLNVMLADNRITTADYQYRYSDVGCLRSFLYLQLGIHFGSVPYVTDPIATVNDLKDVSKFPRISFQALLGKLISFTSALPWLQPYPSVITLVNGSTATLIATQPILNGFNFTNYFINKEVLLGDLYLWNGVYNPADYTNAAFAYKAELQLSITNPSTITGGNVQAAMLKIPFSDVLTHHDISIDYLRFSNQSIYQLENSPNLGWSSMFRRPMYPSYDSFLDIEWIWQMNFPQNAAPADPFLDLFSPSGGRYLAQPSQEGIDLWNSQPQSNNTSGFSNTFSYDARSRLTYNDPTGNYNSYNNQNVIMKNIYIYTDATVSQSNKYGRWFLYRAATLNLRFAEAANRDINRDASPLASIPGQPTWQSTGRVAYALLNGGINGLFNPYNYTTTPGQGFNPTGPVLPNNGSLNSVPPGGDYTNIERTFLPPPYNFDARSGDTPRFREDWYENVGVRNRANLIAYPQSIMADQAGLEDALILENGLETAYEGHRWPDLLRIALRRNDFSGLSAAIGRKLNKDGYAGAGTAQAKLAGGDVYLPFNW
jgi:hypothetical protein